MALIDKAIAGLPAGRHYDGKGTGLFLIVRPDGSRRWGQKIRVGGKHRELGLGTYPEVKLAAARAAAKANKDSVDAGRDPLAEKRAARTKLAETVRTVQDAVDGWVEAHGPAWKSAKTAAMVASGLKRHASGLLKRPVGEIDVDAVRAVLAPLWTEKTVMAGKLRGWLEASLDFAIAAGWRGEPNPADWKRLKPLLAKPSAVHRTRHHPALPATWLHAFMQALRDKDGVAGRALEFCVLTAARSGEVRGMEWTEVDLAARVWVVPARRMKAGREHRVPLSMTAIDLLSRQAKAAGGKREGLVFPNRAGAELTDMALLKVLRDMDAADRRSGGEGWRDAAGNIAVPHGFRSTFRDWCAETGVDHVLAELCLAHVVGSAVERAYRRGDMVERRAALMREWSAFIDKEPAGVVALDVARKPQAGRLLE
jgi:integrase